MVEALDPKLKDKPTVRCTECDREVAHYNTFIEPDNEVRNVCWECLSRTERGFNARRGFSPPVENRRHPSLIGNGR